MTNEGLQQVLNNALAHRNPIRRDNFNASEANSYIDCILLGLGAARAVFLKSGNYSDLRADTYLYSSRISCAQYALSELGLEADTATYVTLVASIDVALVQIETAIKVLNNA